MRLKITIIAVITTGSEVINKEIVITVPVKAKHQILWFIFKENCQFPAILLIG